MDASDWIANQETNRAAKRCVRCHAKHSNEGWYCDRCLGRKSMAYECDECGKSFDKPNALAIHIERSHKKEARPVQKPAERAPRQEEPRQAPVEPEVIQSLQEQARKEAAKPSPRAAFEMAASDLVSHARQSICDRIGESAYAELALEFETLELFGRSR